MTDETPAPLTTQTRAQIEAEIREITGILNSPLSNVERLYWVECRQHLRKQLAALSDQA